MNRFIAFVVRACRALPVAVERAHLRWALEEIDPQHPDVQFIFNRLHELEN